MSRTIYLRQGQTEQSAAAKHLRNTGQETELKKTD
jgi:hypothetical protein